MMKAKVPTEAVGCIIDAGQEAIMEILGQIVPPSLPNPCMMKPQRRSESAAALSQGTGSTGR